MSDDQDNQVRRSSRLCTRKRTSKINYKEIEDGKEYEFDPEDRSEADKKDFELKMLQTMRAKGNAKLSHPKKSLTAYTLFVKIKRKELSEANPDATTPELMKEIGRQWK
jgi:hypothetical protein